MSYFKKLLELIVPEKSRIIQIYLMAGLQGLFYLSIPLFIQAVITYTMAGETSVSLILLCILTIISVIFIGIFELWQLRINESIQQSLLVNVGLKFSNKLTNLQPNLFLNEYLSVKINHFYDLLSLQKGLGKILLDVSFSVISIVFGLLLLSAYNPLFLLFTLLTVVAFYLIIKSYGKRALEHSLAASRNKHLFVNWLHNLHDGLRRNDKNFTEEYIRENTAQRLNSYIKDKTLYYKVIDLQFRSILIFKIIFISALLILGVLFVQFGHLTIGQFVASELLVILVINAIEKLVINLKTVFDVLTATEKLFQVFEMEERDKKQEVPIFKALYDRLIQIIYSYTYSRKFKNILFTILGFCFLLLFMPWTQTVECTGQVTTLDPTARPQTITTRIAGRIEKWYVKEGQNIHKNDTIAFISEIKDNFMDPQLVERSESQIKSKEASIESYEYKINAINSQIDALNKALRLKMEQTKNKIQQARIKIITDSIEMVTAANNYAIAEDQLSRYEELLQKGVISKTDLENRKVKLQETLAKKTSAQNNYNNSLNDLLNAEIELNSIRQEYTEKLMKAESDKLTTFSNLYEAEADLTKMQNQLSNFSIRRGYYYVLAPQDGFISKTFVNGVGEIIKEGDPLCSIVPKQSEQAVELFIEPIDLPLVHPGQKVQLIFDGWPAFVFSGWPGLSTGTYKAEVVAVDRAISPNGKFKILAVNRGDEWPQAIQIGGGVKGFALLKNVMVVYEIWRKVNGFPPEFYKPVIPEQEKSNSESKDDEK